MRRLAICVSLFSIVFTMSPAVAKNPKTPPGPAIAVPSAEDLARLIKRQHPRLLIDAAGFESLRKRIATDPVLKQWDVALRHDANKCLTAKLPEHVLPDGLRLLDTSRRMLQHSYTLAMAYRLHGDQRYVDRLWQEPMPWPSPTIGSTTNGATRSGQPFARR
jgi:hypothetical protein